MRLRSILIFCHLFGVNWHFLAAGDKAQFDDRACTSDATCNGGRGVTCSVCAEGPRGARCLSTFLDNVWYSAGAGAGCALPTTCKVGCYYGSCEMDAGYTAACLCPEDRYHIHCGTAKLPIDEAYRMFQWSRRNAFVVPGGGVIFHYRAVGFKNLRQLIKFQTEFGYSAYLDKAKIESSCTYKNIPCITDSVELKFPFLLPENEYKVNVLKYKNQIKGYLTKIEVQVCFRYDKDLSCLYYVQYLYKVFVSYVSAGFSLQCIAMIRLTNCARSQSDSSKFSFHRNEKVDIKYDVTYLDDPRFVHNQHVCTADDTTWTWTWTVLREGFGYDTPKQIIGRNLIFEKFTLEYGRYRANIKIRRMINEAKNENYDECYFDVRRLPLIAIIDGGQYRTILKSVGITLSALSSHDPNMPEDKQQSLEMMWSCQCLTKDIPGCDATCNFRAAWFPVNRLIFIPGRIFVYNSTYRFTLHVSNDKDRTDTQTSDVTVYVADASVKTAFTYYIICIENCLTEDTLTNEILFLKLRVSINGESSKKVAKSIEFDWEYSKDNETELHTLDSMRIPHLPSSMLALKENSLEVGSSYAIRVSIKNKNNIIAEYSFKTKPLTYNGNCSVKPVSGVKGISNFVINCTSAQGSIFEFYDKTEEELAANVYFSGILLGTSEFLGTLYDVAITRGNIVVYVINKRSKLFIDIKLKVKLSPLTVTDCTVSDIEKNLTSILRLDDLTKTLAYISIIPDILPETEDKGEMLEFLLDAISRTRPNTIADTKLSFSTLKNVLHGLNSPPMSLDVNLVGGILLVISRLGEIVEKAAKSRKTSEWISSIDLKTLSETILECLDCVMLSQYRSITGIPEESMGFDTLFTLRQNADMYIEVIDTSKNILSYTQYPGLPPIKLSTSNKFIKTWAMGNDEDYPVSEMLRRDNEIPFNVPRSLLKSLQKHQQKTGMELYFQAAEIEKNVFSWSESDVKSKLVSLGVYYKKHEDLNKVEELTSPIFVIVPMEKNLTKTRVSGSATQLDSTHLLPSDLDELLTVHRIDTPPRGFVTIRFLFPPTNESLRVLVMENFRPDYELMTKSRETFVITSSTPRYPLRSRVIYDQTFLYMGILPGINVTVNRTVNYVFEVTQNVCQRWIGGQWTSHGCLVSEVTTEGETVCACNHLSIFAAAFPVPPQAIDPIEDARLFLTVLDNPLVVLFVIIVFIIYVLLVIWGRIKDSKDRYKGKVIILDDNFPGDTHPYLMAVHTSARFNAGTTAHVGIMLLGNESNSRAHILSSKRRKVLTRQSDDWFLLYSPKPLGDVYAIHLWHDNHGVRPDWYCDRIVVYDLTKVVESTFIVEQWLAMQEEDFTEAHVLISSDQDMLSVKRMFLNNAIIGFRQSHVFLSVLVRHPRSEVTRVQRISIFMCSIMVAMLCSIMFYVPSNNNTSPSDDYRFTVGMKELIVSVETVVLTAFLTLIVLFAFQRSFKVEHNTLRTTVRYRRDEIAEALSKERKDLVKNSQDYNPHEEKKSKKRKSFYNNFVKYVSKSFKKEALAPAYMWDGERSIRMNVIWYTIAWLACITVIVISSYLVMLYGLKLGLVQSQKWLSSLVMSMSEDMFVTGPGRIIFIAILLSMAFQVSTKVDVHSISYNDAMLARPQIDPKSIDIVLKKRKHQMYAPLSFARRQYILNKKELRRKWWSLIDFFNAAMFMVVVWFVIYRLWTSHFHNVEHLRRSFYKANLDKLGASNIEHIDSMYLVGNYMDFTFVKALFNLWWYNDDEISERNVEGIWKYWFLDFVHKSVSRPDVRQVRVKPHVCHNPFVNMTECLLEWSLRNKDTNAYGEKWRPAMYFDIIKKDSPWHYTELQTALWWTNQRFYGKYGTLYDVSGYTTFLGPSMKEAETTLLELRDDGWQDLRTRAFFASVTAYNVNVKLFTQVTVLFEYFVDGAMYASVTVLSVSRDTLLGVWELLFVFYAVYYSCRGGYLINRMGLIMYLKNVANVLRLIVVTMAFLSIIIWIVHHRTSISYAQKFMVHKQYGVFNFDKFTSIFSLLQVVLSVLVCLTIVRAFVLLRGGRHFLNFYYTLLIALPFLFWLGYGLLVIVFCIVRVQFHLHCESYFKLKELIIPTKMTAFLRNSQLSLHNVQVFLVFKVILMYFVHALFFLLFLLFSRLAKNYNILNSDDFNFIYFVIDRIKMCLKKH